MNILRKLQKLMGRSDPLLPILGSLAFVGTLIMAWLLWGLFIPLHCGCN